MMWVLPLHFIVLTADRFPQQTAANVDQIRDIEERIRSLGGILTCLVGGQDNGEKARREALRRYVPRPWRDAGKSLSRICCHRKLAEIIAKLKPLSKQHGIAKFLKNVDHAQVLNGFVQDLAYAVTDYQVWDGNSVVGAI